MSMRHRLPGLADAVVAAAMLGVLYYLAMRMATWEDFFVEAGPAVRQLLDGDLHGFLALTPAYGGSLLLNAPALALGGAIGGLDGAYRLEMLACATTVAVLALALARIQRSEGRPALSRWLLIGLLVASPAADWALKEGHPEELLTAALCVGGMLLVVRGRITTGAILLGLAVASKQWALLALPIALATIPNSHRVRLAAIAGGVALAMFAPMALAGTGNFVAVNKSLASAPSIFHPQQIWWTLLLDSSRPFGGPHATIFGSAITLVARYSHPLIGLAAVLLGLAYWARRRHVQATDALLILALVMLLRCMLDPWDVVYYAYPCLVALAAWEVASNRRAPLFTLAASCLVWIGFGVVTQVSSGDLANLFYIAWTVPAATMMLWRSLHLPRSFATRARYETTVSSLPSRLRTS